MIFTTPTTQFTHQQANDAYDVWGANCGPGAIAAICGLTLDELRPHMGAFEQRKDRYTNPNLMYQVLKNIGVVWQKREPRTWPQYGLARVQWHGPWMDPDAHWSARRRHSHWVGCAHVKDPRYRQHQTPAASPPTIAIFDINCMNNNGGWSPFWWWPSELVPWLIKEVVPEGNGVYSLTHALEIPPPD